MAEQRQRCSHPTGSTATMALHDNALWSLVMSPPGRAGYSIRHRGLRGVDAQTSYSARQLLAGGVLFAGE
jgi:hypothetical protein